MNKFVASACAVAAGATGASAVNSFDLSQAETAKPWSVEVATRALYDSNPYNKPDVDPSAKNSFGMWVIPKLGVNWAKEQVFLGARYTYDARYYERSSQTDQSHELEGIMDYKPSERVELTVRESFAYSSQPQILQDATLATFRGDQSGFRNRGEINLKAAATRDLVLGAGYFSSIYDYKDGGHPGSYSSLLDRNENLFNVNLLQRLSPGLSIGPGYQFGMVNYTGNDLLYAGGPTSGSRNSTSHYMYLQLDYALTSQLDASIRAGAMLTSFADYSSEGGWNPYGSITLKYTYLRDCTAELGFIHTISSTDVSAATVGGSTPTLGQESSSIYLSIEHRLTRGIWANLWTQAQFSSFMGGAYANQNENFVWVAPSLEYRFDVRPFGALVHLAPQLGYAFQTLASDGPGRDFSRHTVYIGLKATY